MTEKKLTKVQKEILETLRDNPEARIKREYNHVYRLYIGDKRERTIIWDTWLFLKIWLKEDAKLDRFNRTLYTFKPGAEITDAWRRDELTRQELERSIRQAEEEHQKQAEEQQAEARLREVWEVLTSGSVEKEVEIYPHVIIFAHNGRKYYIREEK